MATLTNSEGLVITHTNEFLETRLLQLNASNTYYTAGDNHNIYIYIYIYMYIYIYIYIYIKIGSNKLLMLYHTL